MTRFMTPTFICSFEEPIDLSEISHIYATVTQNNKSITISDEDISIETGTIEAVEALSIYLDQRQSGQFSKGTANIQFNWTFSNGERGGTDISSIPIEDNLLPKVME